MVKHRASTGRRNGGEKRVASVDQDQRESPWLLEKPNVFASTQGTSKEFPETVGSNPAPPTNLRTRLRGLPTPPAKFSSVGNPWRLFWKDKLGDPACPYITRWVMDLGPLGSIRLHHWYGNDDPRAHHDHPWGFLTLVLWGSYVDVREWDVTNLSPAETLRIAIDRADDGALVYVRPGVYEVQDTLRMGSMRWRPATHAHTVRSTGAWTLLWTQPKSRFFGFFVRKAGTLKWIKANTYFHTWGHPPCSDRSLTETEQLEHYGRLID